MPGRPLRLGPFLGGMNNHAEQAAIADNEVAFIENFEVETDGSLKSRPAIIAEEATSPKTGDMTPLGYYTRNDGETFLVVAILTTGTWIYQLSSKTWTSIWGTVASGFVQYDNKIVMISETSAGGYWEAGTFTSTPTMPLGSQITFYLERFWAFGPKGTANATTVWFSNLTVISPPSSIYTWTVATDFFTVQKGDGEWITGLLADTSTLIIFRNKSTYSFTYATSPFLGTLRPLSKTIGADNVWAYGSFENHYFVINSGFLYQFINYRFYPLNTKKIDFGRGSLSNPTQFDVRMSIFGRRVIVWFYGATYVYSITTAAWTTWRSPATSLGHLLTIPPSSVTGDRRIALGVTGENLGALKKLWRIEDGVLQSGSGETIQCTLRTKAYSLNQPAQYKRLLFWTVENRSNAGISTIAYPVAVPIGGTTWNDMNLRNWGDLGTWNNPLIPATTYPDNVSFPTLAPTSEVVKAKAAFRFLKIYFEVFMNTKGTSASAPARIYSISPYLKVHSDVSKKVS